MGVIIIHDTDLSGWS